MTGEDGQMDNGARFLERYRSGDTPWDAGLPDVNLIDVVTLWPVSACRALDVGCGTGDNAIWLSQHGFQVVGADICDLALDRAREKAATAGAACRFVCADFLKDRVGDAPFGFVFDRGCFHSFGTADARMRFARNVAAHLAADGLWLTLAGNADEQRPGEGPPRLTAAELVSVTEPLFEILALISSRFGAGRADPARAWRCLMRKRPVA
jgi:SAM-dependent methyltransferase